jgi:hypothetical protein
MSYETLFPKAGIADGELLAEVRRLAGCEREATARLVAHLGELEARRGETRGLAPRRRALRFPRPERPALRRGADSWSSTT